MRKLLSRLPQRLLLGCRQEFCEFSRNSIRDSFRNSFQGTSRNVFCNSSRNCFWASSGKFFHHGSEGIPSWISLGMPCGFPPSVFFFTRFLQEFISSFLQEFLPRLLHEFFLRLLQKFLQGFFDEFLLRLLQFICNVFGFFPGFPRRNSRKNGTPETSIGGNPEGAPGDC